MNVQVTIVSQPSKQNLDSLKTAAELTQRSPEHHRGLERMRIFKGDKRDCRYELITNFTMRWAD